MVDADDRVLLRNRLGHGSIRLSPTGPRLADDRNRRHRCRHGGDMCPRSVDAARDTRRASAGRDVGQGDDHHDDPRRPSQLRARAAGAGDDARLGLGDRGAAGPECCRRCRRSLVGVVGVAAGTTCACVDECSCAARRRSDRRAADGIGITDAGGAASAAATGCGCRAVEVAAELCRCAGRRVRRFAARPGDRRRECALGGGARRVQGRRSEPPDSRVRFQC